VAGQPWSPISIPTILVKRRTSNGRPLSYRWATEAGARVFLGFATPCVKAAAVISPPNSERTAYALILRSDAILELSSLRLRCDRRLRRRQNRGTTFVWNIPNIAVPRSRAYDGRGSIPR
jgi:hypothetical protein